MHTFVVIEVMPYSGRQWEIRAEDEDQATQKAFQLVQPRENGCTFVIQHVPSSWHELIMDDD